MLKLSLLVVVALILGGCGIPHDPEGSLERIEGGTLRVGYIEHEPWAVTGEDGEPTGVEVELITEFAEAIDAEIEWFTAAESELFDALHLGELDVLLGGITSRSPYSKEAALTHPYLTTQTVVGFPAEPGADPEIAGREVRVEAGTSAAGLLEKTDAVPIRVADITRSEDPSVVDSWLLDDLELVDLGVQLDESDHVMAVRLGENAFMVRLERFLLHDPERVSALLNEVTP